MKLHSKISDYNSFSVNCEESHLASKEVKSFPIEKKTAMIPWILSAICSSQGSDFILPLNYRVVPIIV